MHGIGEYFMLLCVLGADFISHGSFAVDQLVRSVSPCKLLRVGQEGHLEVTVGGDGYKLLFSP